MFKLLKRSLEGFDIAISIFAILASDPLLEASNDFLHWTKWELHIKGSWL